MNLENLSEVVFSFTEISQFPIEANFKFVYNNYNEKETTIDDDVFVFSNTNVRKNKFIRIEIENPVQFGIDRRNDFDAEEFYALFYNNVLVDFVDKDLYENERNFFNKIDNLCPNRTSLILDSKFDEFKNYYNFYASKNNNLSKEEFDNKFDNSKTISFSRKEEILSGFISKDYPEIFNTFNVESYNELISNESVERARSKSVNSVDSYKNCNLLPNLNYVSREINNGDIIEYAKKNNLFCGLYVEKYILKNGKYNFKCARFFDRKPNTTKQEGISLIEDEAVRYGETYRYVCYNTYIMTTLENKNRFLLQNYLLCTHPYISNDIVCKEFTPPPPPTSFTADYNKSEKALMLSWRHPNNYENDVKGYQILKRHSLEEPYVLIKQLEGHLSTDLYELTENILDSSIIKTPGYIPDFYLDESYEKQKLSIYTIRSIDAHGMVSNYGEQIAVYYDLLRDKLIVDLVSYSGAQVLYPNEKLLPKTKFFENKIDVIDNLPLANHPQKITLYITPDYGSVVSNGEEEKIYNTTENASYQFTFSNLNNLIYRSDKFTITNFG